MKDIPNYENKYAATEDGRIYSYRKKGFLKPWLSAKGYLFVVLYKNGRGKKFLVHRLIAETFLDNPNELPQVNHIDQCKTNNCVSNLEFCTASYNKLYSAARKIKCLETGVIYNSEKEAAEELHLGKGNLWAVLNGRRNTTGGFHFEYIDERND